MAEDKGVLGVEEVDAELESLDGGSREGVTISRDFVLANFGTIAAQNHHPDFSLDTGTRTVAVSVTTHSEGAVTRADINFARALNTWSAQG